MIGKVPTLDEISVINLRTIVDPRGSLVPLEFGSDIPFSAKRSFYIFDNKVDVTRGYHAHYKTQQFLVCIRGLVRVVCKDGESEAQFLLEGPNQGIYIPELIWDEITYKTEDAMIMVFSNTHYNRGDYIFSLDDLKKVRKELLEQ